MLPLLSSSPSFSHCTEGRGQWGPETTKAVQFSVTMLPRAGPRTWFPDGDRKSGALSQAPAKRGPSGLPVPVMPASHCAQMVGGPGKNHGGQRHMLLSNHTVSIHKSWGPGPGPWHISSQQQLVLTCSACPGCGCPVLREDFSVEGSGQSHG